MNLPSLFSVKYPHFVGQVPALAGSMSFWAVQYPHLLIQILILVEIVPSAIGYEVLNLADSCWFFLFVFLEVPVSCRMGPSSYKML